LIRTAQSNLSNARAAVRELHTVLWHDAVELVLFFCSSTYDLDALAEELNRQFAGVQVVGCTTAGEIGPLGFVSHSICGVSFGTSVCRAVSGRMETLRDVSLETSTSFVHGLLQSLETRATTVTTANTFAFMLIDGLSGREEFTAHALQRALGGIASCGGSAGDGLHFDKTFVFQDGRFHRSAAALVLVTTTLPFQVFKTQHFARRDERLIVTGADVARRVVTEINGLPAAREYARIIGADVRALSPERFASHPLVVMIDGSEYVRSIRSADSDGQLIFYCAIEEGLVLRAAEGVDLIANLQSALKKVEERVGSPQLVIACDCTLRNLEIAQRGLRGQVDAIMRNHNCIGFGTYGEQFNGVHVNQTLTGIAIGGRGRHG
jgi:hypothetical protein